jgi:hypothetical protein
MYVEGAIRFAGGNTADITGSNNVRMGSQAAPNDAGTYNIAIGNNAGLLLSTASSNIMIGQEAGDTISVGNYNTCMGQRAGDTITAGSYNVCIGMNADVNSGAVNNAVALGQGAVASGSYQIRLGSPSHEVHMERVFVQGTIETGLTNQATTSGTYTVDFSAGHMTRITLDGDMTFTLSNAFDGQKHVLQIKQDGTGGHDVTWPANVRWPGSTEPTLTTAADAIDYIEFIYDAADDEYDGVNSSLNMG